MHIKLISAITFSVIFLVSCSSKIPTLSPEEINLNTLKIPHDKDILGIGLTPTPPSKKAKLLEGIDNSKNILKLENISKLGDVEKLKTLSKNSTANNSAPMPNPPKSTATYPHKNIVNGPNHPFHPEDPFDTTKVFYNKSYLSDDVSIIGQNDALITIWATAQLNWVWGYSPLNSLSFGDARIWNLIIYPKNFVQIQNKLTKTCLNAYGSSVVHATCNVTNQAQFWELKPFTNNTVALKNFASGECLASDDTKGESFYSLNLVPCAKGFNTDQQWQIIPPTRTTTPINIKLK